MTMLDKCAPDESLCIVQCSDCRFYHKLDDDREGQCRYYAPIVGAYHPQAPYDPSEAAWPYLKGTEWCGRFEQITRFQFAEGPRT